MTAWLIKYCYNTWCAESIGTRNDDIFIPKWHIRKDSIINIINMFDTIDIMLNFANLNKHTKTWKN